MNKAQKEQLKEKVAEITCLTILLNALIFIFLFGMDISSDTNLESQVGEVSYITQLEWLAGSKGYTTEGNVTYKERQQLETEEGRYIEVMKYLEGVEVSESEFQEIKEIQSKYEQSVQQENNSERKDYSLLIAIVFGILTIIVVGLLITTAIGAY